MRILTSAFAVALLVSACSGAQDVTQPETTGIEGAVADASRPPEDRQLDVSRHPAEVLLFAGVEPGWKVADLSAGGGYYTRILSAAVGEAGHVYAHNAQWVADRFPDTDQGLANLAAERANVTHVVAPIEQFASGVEEPLDAVFMVLFYHDTGWDGTDRTAMNAAIFDALEPGGVYLVIDHHAPNGTGIDHVEDWHRIEADLVREEIMAAGFELDAESDMLANTEDGRQISVFDPEIRRQTDRFVFRFRKPG
ncbi:class I SAM-dependent methyltransferase [Maricaulis sp. CAU 1757]